MLTMSVLRTGQDRLTLPSRSTVTSSQRSNSSFRWWVMNTTPVPRAAICRTMPNRRCTSWSESALVGSSSTSATLARRSALASSTICCSPMPSWPTSASRGTEVPSRLNSLEASARSARTCTSRPGRVRSALRKMLSSTESVGTRLRSWKTMPSPDARASPGSEKAILVGPTSSSPALGLTAPSAIFMRVDLPAPFAPTRPWTVPFRTWKSTPRSACVRPKVLTIPRIRSANRAWSSPAVGSGTATDPDPSPLAKRLDHLGRERDVGTVGEGPAFLEGLLGDRRDGHDDIRRHGLSEQVQGGGDGAGPAPFVDQVRPLDEDVPAAGDLPGAGEAEVDRGDLDVLAASRVQGGRDTLGRQVPRGEDDVDVGVAGDHGRGDVLGLVRVGHRLLGHQLEVRVLGELVEEALLPLVHELVVGREVAGAEIGAVRELLVHLVGHCRAHAEGVIGDQRDEVFRSAGRPVARSVRVGDDRRPRPAGGLECGTVRDRVDAAVQQD